MRSINCKLIKEDFLFFFLSLLTFIILFLSYYYEHNDDERSWSLQRDKSNESECSHWPSFFLLLLFLLITTTGKNVAKKYLSTALSVFSCILDVDHDQFQLVPSSFSWAPSGDEEEEEEEKRKSSIHMLYINFVFLFILVKQNGELIFLLLIIP